MIFLLFLSFRKKLSKLWDEWSIAMEIMDHVDVSLEKFVIRHNIDRENVPLMRRVIMKSLTREFLLLSEGNPERQSSVQVLY